MNTGDLIGVIAILVVLLGLIFEILYLFVYPLFKMRYCKVGDVYYKNLKDKNPFEKNKLEVEIANLTKKDYLIMLISSISVTTIFYFILDLFGTANIVVSTISVFTTFTAVFLTYKRSEFFALGYLVNDIVLIVLWLMACVTDIKYISVVAGFFAFMFMDSYTFINWSRMKKRQQRAIKQNENT